MITKVVSASSGAHITHLDHASVFIHSVNAINYTALVSEFCESLHPHFITFNNTSELWAEKKINETFAIKMPSFLTNFLSDFMRREAKHLTLGGTRCYPAHYIIIFFSFCWLYLAGRLAPPDGAHRHLHPTCTLFYRLHFIYFFFFYLEVDGPDAVDNRQPCLITQTRGQFIMPIGSFSSISVLAA